MKIDLAKYEQFVAEVTSEESNSPAAMLSRLDDMIVNNHNVNVALLVTAALGLTAESGEFAEIPKKMIFQGKPLNEDNVFHMKRELGDIMWYWMNACRALGMNPNEVIDENIRKLEARYPGGSFDAHYSENRQDGDV